MTDDIAPNSAPRIVRYAGESFEHWMDENGLIRIVALSGGPIAAGYAKCASRLLNLEGALTARGLMDGEGRLRDERT